MYPLLFLYFITKLYHAFIVLNLCIVYPLTCLPRSYDHGLSNSDLLAVCDSDFQFLPHKAFVEFSPLGLASNYNTLRALFFPLNNRRTFDINQKVLLIDLFPLRASVLHCNKFSIKVWN